VPVARAFSIFMWQTPTAGIHELFANDYRGWVSGEFLPQPDVEMAAQRGITYLRQQA
jgi:hypothetical protein